jgi:outer membrane protein assembly factor BamB
MNRRSLSLIVIGLISIIFTSSFIAYEVGFKRAEPEPEPEPAPEPPEPEPEPIPEPDSSPYSGALWQRPIEHFAIDVAVDDGKVFMTDNSGNVNCFDSQNGESIWNGSLGREGGYHSIVISESRVYVSFKRGRVGCFDEDNGTLLWSFQNPQAPNSISEGSPEIIVNDGRVFVRSDTTTAHNATTGELLWQSISKTITAPNNIWSGREVYGFLLGGDPFDGKYVYGIEGKYESMRFFKLNTDNGYFIWRSNVTWNGTPFVWGNIKSYLPRLLTISQGKVIINGIFQGTSSENLLFCLDSHSGKELWRIDVGATVYNPTVYNNLLVFSAENDYFYALNLANGTIAWKTKGDPQIYNPTVYNNLLLFSAADGYFYALNLADGTIAWKTKVDTQNLFSLGIQASSIQIDSKNQRLFWNYFVEQTEGSNNYTGTLCSLDLANGNVKWMTPINSSRPGWWSYGLGGRSGLAINNNTDRIFLCENWGLWIFNTSTGDLVKSQQFDHRVLAPIVLGNKTFVIGDLWLFAYT